MDSLELKSPMQEVQPCRTSNVHCCTELTLWEGFAFAEVRCGHPPVGEGNLDMQWHSDYVTDQHERNPESPGRYRAPYEAIAKKKPVASHKGQFCWAYPPCSGVAKLFRVRREEEVVKG